VKIEAVLVALMGHYECGEIRGAQSISDILSLQSRGIEVSVSLGEVVRVVPVAVVDQVEVVVGVDPVAIGDQEVVVESGVPKTNLPRCNCGEPSPKRGRTKEGPREGLGKKDTLKSRSVETGEPELSDQSGE